MDFLGMSRDMLGQTLKQTAWMGCFSIYLVQGKLDDYKFLAVFKLMIKIRLLRGVSLCKRKKLKTKVCGYKEESDNVPQTGGGRDYYQYFCFVVVTSNFSVLRS